MRGREVLGTFAARFRARVERARREGWGRTLADIAGRSVTLLAGVLLIPAAAVAHFAGYRRITFIVSRIGHLAAEPDSFLKSVALGELPGRKYFAVAPPGAVANEHLLSYWATRIPIVRGPMLCRLLNAMSALGLMRFDAGRYVLRLDRSQEAYRINARWARRAPVLALTEEDNLWAEKEIAALGVPRGGWFVCVHAREEGFSPEDEGTHAHRNGSIEALVPAMREIVARGGYCVRMGGPTTRPLPVMDGVFDYAHHGNRNPRLDIVLCAKAKFFLGNSSGIALVSSVFGVPAALANMVPLSALALMPFDLSMPKLYRSRQDGRLLGFDEIFGTPAANFRYAHQYSQSGIELVENAAEEILEMAKEMLDRLDGRYSPQAEDETLQRRFMALMRRGDYGYGASSRIAAAFLRRYARQLGAGTRT
jgi:putative glycosyltransferase (TIGR04372 family)